MKPADGPALAEELAGRLDRGPTAEGARVESWRFELAAGESIRAGLEDGALGGPYQPPGSIVGTGGSLELGWSDGLTTLAAIDRTVISEFEGHLAGWRASAYHDRWAAPPLAPRPLPDVATADPAAYRMLEADPTALFDLLERARRVLAGHGAGRIDVTVGVGGGRRWIRSSAGLRVNFPETSFSLHVSADELYWEAFSKRRLASDEEIAGLVNRVGRTAAALRQDDVLPPGTDTVLLVPRVVEDFVGRFLGANLAGRAVVRGQSAFTPDDFRARRTVLREDLDVVADTTLPLESAASPCSAEGVPGGRVSLIEAGRLVTPLLDLRSARRAELPPTPLPRGRPSLLLAPCDGGAAEVESALGDGLVVSFVMGLRTQDVRSGRYSVVAPQARVVRGGVSGGKVAVRIGGSFFDQLRDPATRAVRVPGQLSPALVLRCDVRPDAATPSGDGILAPPAGAGSGK